MTYSLNYHLLFVLFLCFFAKFVSRSSGVFDILLFLRLSLCLDVSHQFLEERTADVDCILLDDEVLIFIGPHQVNIFTALHYLFLFVWSLVELEDALIFRFRSVFSLLTFNRRCLV